MAPDSRRKAQGKGKSGPAKRSHTQTEKRSASSQTIPIELQQLLLNIFRNSFANILGSDIIPVLQEVKGHLYNRDFAAAFGKDAYLEAYAARWSPSRALGYLHIFWEMREFFNVQKLNKEETIDNQQKTMSSHNKVVCLGGGAGAEIVALAGLQRLVSNQDNAQGQQDSIEVEVVAIDLANWANVVEKLAENITTAPPLSKYASAAIQASNCALVNPDKIKISFEQEDIFKNFSIDAPSSLKGASVVMLMFTLNELYSTSMSSTQRFLLTMTEILSPGSILLVIDSPGSYSTVTLNGAEKKYPMQWLLDHTLLKQAAGKEKRGEDTEVKWEKIQEDESRWFRLDAALNYPIELENMRMQLHLYRRL